MPIFQGGRGFQVQLVQPILTDELRVLHHQVVHKHGRVADGIDMAVRGGEQALEGGILIQHLLDVGSVLFNQLVQRNDGAVQRHFVYAAVGPGGGDQHDVRQFLPGGHAGLHGGVVIGIGFPGDLHARVFLNLLPAGQVVVDGHRGIPALQTGEGQGFAVSKGLRQGGSGGQRQHQRQNQGQDLLHGFEPPLNLAGTETVPRRRLVEKP